MNRFQTTSKLLGFAFAVGLALGTPTPMCADEILSPRLMIRNGFINNDGPVFWFVTDKDAPRKRVIAIDTRHPESRKEIIPEAPETLGWINVVGDRFFAGYLKDAQTQVKVFALDGTPRGEVALPGIGSAWGFGGKRSDRETFYAFTSFTVPTIIYRYDVRTGKSTLFRKPKVDFASDAYETRQVFYRSKDGTRVPMFITCKKGITLDGTNPTYLYGSGGFQASMTPRFSPPIPAWLEMGGVYAVANLRGGIGLPVLGAA